MTISRMSSRTWTRVAGGVAVLVAGSITWGASSSAAQGAAVKGATRSAATAGRAAPADSDAVTRAWLAAESRSTLQRLHDLRREYLARSDWADLGDRCNPGALRVFLRDTTPEQRDSLQRLVERMEQVVVARGVGSDLGTPALRSLLRTIVGWEAGIDRPRWDEDGTLSPRMAVAAGLTGEVPDPRSVGCLPSPVLADTVTFVVPGFRDMEFPKAPSPRVKAYFGPQGQQRARDEFFAATGSRSPESDLSYIVVAPIVHWQDFALVGVDRPKDRGGVDIRSGSNGGAVYLMRRVGAEWRLLSVVRSWGS